MRNDPVDSIPGFCGPSGLPALAPSPFTAAFSGERPESCGHPLEIESLGVDGVLSDSHRA